jgi:phage-related protein
MPLCRAMGGGLWEVRSALPSNRIARVLFSVHGGRILTLHGFIKKSRTTPDDDLALAADENVNSRIEGDHDGQKSKEAPQRA